MNNHSLCPKVVVKLLFKTLLPLLTVFFVSILSTARADIYVALWGTNKMARYDGSGSTLVTKNTSFITNLNSSTIAVLDGMGGLYARQSSQVVARYDAETGACTGLITGMSNPAGLAMDGIGNLYVANLATNSIGKYNAATGAVINASLITGLSSPMGIAIDKGVIYVTNSGNGTVGAYTTSGATIKSNLITGLTSPYAVAVDPAGTVYVASSGSGNKIGKYNGITGAAINASFITGLNDPRGIALDGGYIYVTNFSANTVTRHNAVTGTITTPNPYISLSSGPWGLAVAPSVTTTTTSLTSPLKNIYYPANATTELINTANELRNGLNAMSTSSPGPFAAPLPYPSSSPYPSDAIVIGKGVDLGISELPDVWAAPTYDAKGREHYTLGVATATGKSYVIIAGTTEPAVSRGVYDFLQQMGSRWFFPGENWKYIPKSASLSWVAPTRIRTQTLGSLFGTSNLSHTITTDEVPEYKQRFISMGGLSSSGDWAPALNDWLAWAKTARVHAQGPTGANVSAGATDKPGGLFIGIGHNYGNIATWAQVNDAALWNNNMWSLIGGVRTINAQLGVSNQGAEAGIHQIVKDYAISGVNSYLGQYPLIDYVNMSPNDGGPEGWCECAFCKLIQDHTDAVGNPYKIVTNRVVYLANQVASVIPATKYVCYAAYSAFHAPPSTGRDPSTGPTGPVVAFTPASNSYVQVTEGMSTEGTGTAQCLELWLRQVRNLGYYNILDFIKGDTGTPHWSAAANSHYIASSAGLFRNNNADIYCGEAAGSWGPNGLGYYLFSKVLWKSNTDTAPLKAEFFTKCFGAASATMAHFYNFLDTANKYEFNTDILGRLYQDLQTARGQESNADVVKRLDDLTLWVRYCELWLAYIGTDASVAPGSPRQVAIKNLLQFTWQIRSTNMVETRSLFTYIGFIDTVMVPKPNTSFSWPALNDAGLKPYPVSYPGYLWSAEVPAISPENGAAHPFKPAATYDHAAIVTMNTTGVTNWVTNQPLQPADPTAYSYDVVPSCRAANAVRGNLCYQLHGSPIYMHTDKTAGDTLPQLTINTDTTTAGGWLYRASDFGLLNPLERQLIGTANTSYIVPFASYGKGGYLYYYNGIVNQIDSAPGKSVSVAARPSMPVFSLYYTNRRYFYVPKGTRYVIAHVNAIAAGGSAGAQFCNQAGVVKTFSAQPFGTAPVYNLTHTLVVQYGGMLNVELIIPVGTTLPPYNATTAFDDDQIWSISDASGGNTLQLNTFYFRNIPGLLARNTDELVMPKDAYANLKPCNLPPVAAGLGASVKGVTHFYIHTDGTGTTLPTLTLTNAPSGGNATWKLYHEKDDITTATPIATGTINAGVSGATIAPTVPSAGCYHLVYDDHLASNNSTLTWPSGKHVVMAANPKEPLPYISTPYGARRYFYVPKGTKSVKITASTMAASYFVIASGPASGTVVGYQAGASNVVVNLVPQPGLDGQMWYMGSPNATNVSTNLVFHNIPGHLATDVDQALLPQWMANEAQNLY